MWFCQGGDATTNMAAGEFCDDGGNSAACDSDCTAAACGDAFVNPAASEDCDDAGESATCDADCSEEGGCNADCLSLASDIAVSEEFTSQSLYITFT